MKKIIIILSFFYSINTFAQEAPKVKFEKVSEEELKMSVYPADTAAEAVILFDDGCSEVRFDVSRESFILSFDRFVRIKILKQSGTEWGNFSFPLYSSGDNRETIALVKGTTFNYENGKVVKTEMKKESIFGERENKYIEMVRLSLPAVKVGSVIDLKYTISSPLLWNLREWKFQYTIPVKWSQYQVNYPEYFKYNHSATGYHTLNPLKQERKNVTINYTAKYQTAGSALQGGGLRRQENKSFTYIANVFDYSAREVPALKEEPYLTTLDNYTTKIKFELAQTDLVKVGGSFKNYTTTWDDIANLLLEDEEFGGQIKSANYASDEIGRLTTGMTDQKQKMIAIYSLIQNSIKWNGSKSHWPSQSLKKCYSEKNGNSADINLLLTAMLREAGIEANPVILSTRENGLISLTHPSLSDCNYVIAKAMIDGSPVLLDATERNLQAGLIPYRCLNGTGRLIKKDAVEEVELINGRSNNNTIVRLELKADKFEGNISSRNIGLSAFNFREAVKEAGGQKEYFDMQKNKFSDFELKDYAYSNLDSIYLPVIKKYNINLANESADADILYFSPVLVGRTTENPFTSPQRIYPVDFGYSSNDIYQINLAIPEGYKVEELPQSKSFSLEGKGGSYIYQVTQSGSTISLTTKFTIDKTLYLPTEYKMLREFFNLIVAKESEQIVLKKIN